MKNPPLFRVYKINVNLFILYEPLSSTELQHDRLPI